MARVDVFPQALLEQIAQILGECGTGSEIDRVFRALNVRDESGESTKWKRLYWWFESGQSNMVVPTMFSPLSASFLRHRDSSAERNEFDEHRARLNQALAFAGTEYGADGQFRHVAAARTLGEAEQRAQTIRSKFRGRRIHPEVLKYCRAELMQENYFHAVFEAAKGLAQRIREMTGVLDRPLLALNRLETETAKSEHKGLAALLKGCFAAIRNPLAHGPKILWEGEEDAADYFTLISLLHYKLDKCVRTRFAATP